MFGLSINCLVKCDDDYSLSFQAGAEMIYEYSHVNITLLIQLAVEDYSYNGFYTIPQGFQIEWIVRNVVKSSDRWTVNVDVYRGASFNEYAGDFEIVVYKNPNDLSYELYNGTGNELYFIPINVYNYLNFVDQSIPSLENNYSYVLNNSIVFDYTQLGANDTISYAFNKHGLMSTYQISYNGTLAFSLELKSFSLGIFDTIFLTVIITSLVLIFLISAYFIIRKKRLKKTENVKKLLKKIK